MLHQDVIAPACSTWDNSTVACGGNEPGLLGGQQRRPWGCSVGWRVGSQGGEDEDEGVGRSQSPGRSGFILSTVTEVPSESSPGWMGR